MAGSLSDIVFISLGTHCTIPSSSMAQVRARCRFVSCSDAAKNNVSREPTAGGALREAMGAVDTDPFDMGHERLSDHSCHALFAATLMVRSKRCKTSQLRSRARNPAPGFAALWRHRIIAKMSQPVDTRRVPNSRVVAVAHRQRYK